MKFLKNIYLSLFEKAAKDSVVGFIFVYAFSYLFPHILNELFIYLCIMYSFV